MKKEKKQKALSITAHLVLLATCLLFIVSSICVKRGLFPFEKDSVIVRICSNFSGQEYVFVIFFAATLLSLLTKPLINKRNAKRIDNQNENIRTEQIEYFKKLLDEGIMTKEEFAEKEKSIKSQAKNKQKRT